jgi:predicted membrane metal-binding protein
MALKINTYLLIVFIFFSTSALELNFKKKFRNQTSSGPISTLYKKNLSECISSKKYFNKNCKSSLSMSHALLTGQKHYLLKKRKEQIKLLGISHLFSPSGLHVGFLGVLKVFPHFINTGLVLFLFILFLTQPGFFPIKRILIFKLLYLAKLTKNFKVIFILTFILDYILGSYSQSPFSSLLSFLFWGTIVFHNSNDNLRLWKKLALNQIFVSLIFHQDLSLWSFIINPILSLLIVPLFPLLVCCYLLMPITSTAIIYSGIILETFFSNIEFLSSPIWKLETFGFCMILYLFTLNKKKSSVFRLIYLIGTLCVFCSYAT